MWLELVSVLLLLSFFHADGAWSNNESSDLDLIPTSIAKKINQDSRPVSPTADVKAQGKKQKRKNSIALKATVFLENAFSATTYHNNLLVPVPSSPPPSGANGLNRTSLDVIQEARPNKKVQFHLSDRVDLFASNNLKIASQASIRNDLREAYVSFEPVSGNNLDAGRINLKRGVGYAFSPTDYFKTRTSLAQTSSDPSAAKNNRIGVTQVSLKNIWPSGSIGVSFAPKLQSVFPLASQTPTIWDPLLGQTNYSNRILASATLDVANLSPEFSYFHDNEGVNRFGFSATTEISSHIISYVEWSGASEPLLSTRAINFGVNAGELPYGTPSLPQTDQALHFENDFSIGFSYTESTWAKLTFNLEYSYHQSGFNKDDFKNWINEGSQSEILSELFWYIRAYAADQQEPLTQHQIFGRLEWDDAFFSYLNLSFLAFVSPLDRSLASQISATYLLNSKWTFGLYLTGINGDPTTVFGSNPQKLSGTIQILRYLK